MGWGTVLIPSYHGSYHQRGTSLFTPNPRIQEAGSTHHSPHLSCQHSCHAFHALSSTQLFSAQITSLDCRSRLFVRPSGVLGYLEFSGAKVVMRTGVKSLTDDRFKRRGRLESKSAEMFIAIALRNTFFWKLEHEAVILARSQTFQNWDDCKAR